MNSLKIGIRLPGPGTQVIADWSLEGSSFVYKPFWTAVGSSNPSGIACLVDFVVIQHVLDAISMCMSSYFTRKYETE